MNSAMLKTFLCTLFIIALSSTGTSAWGSSKGDKVLLRDVQVITLHQGRMTTGRRSAPVPQLKCVGGSAAHEYNPPVVQCYNRGFDGQDVQWECKADMDRAYRFGAIEVVCEGFDYPDDPYILKGSCGLEYTLDYSPEGHEKRHSGYGSYFSHQTHHKTTGLRDLIVFGVACLIIYALYKTCIAGGREYGDTQYSSTNDDYPRGNPGGGGWFGMGGGGGGYGRGGGGYYGGGYDDATCGNNARYRGTGVGGGGGGFWTGLATGGLLGYMFGGNRGGYGRNYYHNAGYQGGWGGSTWGGGSGFGSGSSFGGGGGGTAATGSTRTASGFGGTRRR